MSIAPLALARVTAPGRALAIICLLSLLALACRDSQNDSLTKSTASRPPSAPAAPSPDCINRPVRMAVASSLREIALLLRQELLAAETPIQLELVLGASSTHARQLRLGAPLDIIVSADEEIVRDLTQNGFVAGPLQLQFARGQLSLIARPKWASGKPMPVQLDAARFERLAIPSAAVPLGRYARAWLGSLDLLETLKGKIVVTEHARATLAAVDSGLVDLAIVYRSEVRLAKNALAVSEIDSSDHPPIRYVAARATRAPACSSIDVAIAGWARPRVQSELLRAGFIPIASMGAG